MIHSGSALHVTEGCVAVGTAVLANLCGYDFLRRCFRWKSAVVATNGFHQFRAFRTFRCAAKQILPPDQQPQVHPKPAVPGSHECVFINVCCAGRHILRAHLHEHPRVLSALMSH